MEINNEKENKVWEKLSIDKSKIRLTYENCTKILP